MNIYSTKDPCSKNSILKKRNNIKSRLFKNLKVYFLFNKKRVSHNNVQKNSLIYYYALQHAISKIVNNCEYCVYRYKSDECKNADCQKAMTQYFLDIGQKIYYKKLKLKHLKNILKLK